MKAKVKRKFTITILFLISALIIAFIINYFFINIYEVIIEKTPEYLYADKNSTIKLEVVPINALGFRSPFRTVKSNFKIVEGNDLIEIIKKDELNGILILRSKGSAGKAAVVIHTGKSLLPSYVEIQILPNTVSKKSILPDKVI